MFTVCRAETLAKNYDEDSAYGALENAIPSMILRRHNPRGDLSPKKLCRNLKAEFNSSAIMFQERQDPLNFRLDEAKPIGDEIMRFTMMVAEYNIRCQEAGRKFPDKV